MRQVDDSGASAFTSAGGSDGTNEAIEGTTNCTVKGPVSPKRKASWKETAAEWQLRGVLGALGKSTTGERHELISRITEVVESFAEPAESLAKSLGGLIDSLKIAPVVFEESLDQGVGPVRGDPGSKGQAVLASLRKVRAAANAHAEACRNVDVFEASRMHSPTCGLGNIDLMRSYLPFMSMTVKALFPLLRAEVNGKLAGGNASSIVSHLSACVQLLIQVTSATATEKKALTHDNRGAPTKFAVENAELRQLWKNCCASTLAELFDDTLLKGIMRAPTNAAQTTDGSVMAAVAAKEKNIKAPRVSMTFPSVRGQSTLPDPKQVLQLPPHALMELHEAFHGAQLGRPTGWLLDHRAGLDGAGDGGGEGAAAGHRLRRHGLGALSSVSPPPSWAALWSTGRSASTVLGSRGAPRSSTRADTTIWHDRRGNGVDARGQPGLAVSHEYLDVFPLFVASMPSGTPEPRVRGTTMPTRVNEGTDTIRPSVDVDGALPANGSDRSQRDHNRANGASVVGGPSISGESARDAHAHDIAGTLHAGEHRMVAAQSDAPDNTRDDVDAQVFARSGRLHAVDATSTAAVEGAVGARAEEQRQHLRDGELVHSAATTASALLEQTANVHGVDGRNRGTPFSGGEFTNGIRNAQSLSNALNITGMLQEITNPTNRRYDQHRVSRPSRSIRNFESSALDAPPPHRLPDNMVQIRFHNMTPSALASPVELVNRMTAIGRTEGTVAAGVQRNMPGNVHGAIAQQFDLTLDDAVEQLSAMLSRGGGQRVEIRSGRGSARHSTREGGLGDGVRGGVSQRDSDAGAKPKLSVLQLAARLRAIGSPIESRTACSSHNALRLIEHVMQWELIGHAGCMRLNNVGELDTFSMPVKLSVTERVAKLAVQDGRWLSALVRSLMLTDMHVQTYIFNSLTAAPHDDSLSSSSTPNAPGIVFCSASATVMAMVLGEWVDAGSKPPSAHATTWWQALAILSECLISWCCGPHWVATAVGPGSASPPQLLAAHAAVICGLAGGSVNHHKWGCAPAAAAPKLLSLLSTAHVPEQALDSVSGCMFLLARLISSAAKANQSGKSAVKGGNSRWKLAVQRAKEALTEVLPRAMEGAAAWASQMRSLGSSIMVHYGSSVGARAHDIHNLVAEAWTEDAVGTSIGRNPAFDIFDPKNSRRAMHLGLLIALTASWTKGRGGLLRTRRGELTDEMPPFAQTNSGRDADTSAAEDIQDSALSTFIDSDDDVGSTMTSTALALPVGVQKDVSPALDAQPILPAVDLMPIHAALGDAMATLAYLASSLGIIGWASDGAAVNQHPGCSSNHPGLNLLASSRWLSASQGEFPVHSPAQQLVDMVQLLIYAFVELRPASETPLSPLVELLANEQWRKTFLLLHGAAPNMFNYGSSLDLVGGLPNYFPFSFKVARLRTDLKRHVQDAMISQGLHLMSPMTLAVSRRAPLAGAYHSVALAPARELLGRCMSAIFEGEEGIGDGVSREAAQVMMNAVLDGPEGRTSEALFVPWPPPEDRFVGGGNFSAATATNADARFETLEAHHNPEMTSFAAIPALRTINPDVPAAHCDLVYRFIGRLVGMIIASGMTVTLPLAPWIWSAMLGRRGTMKQLENVDEEQISRTMMHLYTHPLEDELNAWALDQPPTFSRTVAVPMDMHGPGSTSFGDATDVAPRGRDGNANECSRQDPAVVTASSAGATQHLNTDRRLSVADAVKHVTFDLIPNGRDVTINNSNRKHYVELYARHRMETVHGKSILPALRALRSGLTQVIPAELLTTFTPLELERLVCGAPKIDVASWREATSHEGRGGDESMLTQQATWLWEAVEAFDPRERQKLLHFWASYTRLPHTKFQGLHFKVRFDPTLSTEHLPTAQTCFLTLRMPIYASAEQLSERLLRAIRYASSGFAFM